MDDQLEKSVPFNDREVSKNEEITAVPELEEVQDIVDNVKQQSDITPEMRSKIAAFYGRKAEEDHLAPSADVVYIIDKIILMTEQKAIDILVKAIEYHSGDPNFPGPTMEKIKLLVQGPKIYGMENSDYEFDLKAEAAIIRYHSPYPEVRSVTDPFDDPTTPCETFRSYFLGLVWMAGTTALNTFFSPRQPAITITASVLQLLIAPCGIFFAKVLPDWGITVFGTRHSLNPGPWSYKEQMFATIIFNISNSVGGVYYVYLVQQLPQYLNQKWVTFGYEIMLALSTQFFGLGLAGLLRRFVIYPVTAIWPKNFPTLALNRALVVPEKKGEVVNGWNMSRYRFFMWSFLAMFLYFWIPNFLFNALHAFNWMTWIAPNNFNLGMVTGFYGGMGFNPWATFDWNVAGTGMLVTPFFSAIQQYGARVLSGIIIIAMYYSNFYWSAYIPINSNESFTNNGTVYDVTQILNDKGDGVDIEKYKSYGPPYFSGANVFGQGAWFAWYPMTLFYVSIQHYESLKRAFYDMYRGIRYRNSAFGDNDDPHSRMMRAYPEVADWWFIAVLLISLVLGIVALKAYPVDTPVWTLFAVVGLSAVFLIPSALLLANANVTMGFNVLFQLLAGYWFVGNPEALIIVTAYGQNFNSQAENYISDQKMGHYAKIPPRAVFRGQMISVLINCFIFIGMLDWMVDNFDHGTLCEWNNPQHFVCTDAVLVFASAIEYGAFGAKNFFTLYPFLPWCFLVGGLVGIVWGVVQKFGPHFKAACRRRWSEGTFATWDKWMFRPLELFAWFDPAVFWAGALNWTGGNNLPYATNGIYLSFIFMHYIKRRYGPWWEKYNYLLEAGFDVGVAISGIIQTFAFDFGPSVVLNWWGNTVSTAGVDYQSYNQNATLYPIPASGYFGLAPADFPMKF
ncbi:related to Oligopeptide transporter 2 [Phialocephala subalpina]|uniref:Related to Oligopeptide transporter 2 n=1 Tax=Phialocephala subalpina TaxID=576137 RepID=A0A1L7XDE8_9HELO|nr:related to Oligopeptide transporter 2 [Phialocephala subalpina]